MTRWWWVLVLAACGNSREQPETAPVPSAPARSPDLLRPEPDEPAPPPAECAANARTTCVRDSVVECNHGTPGRTLLTCKGACKAGACVDTCAVNDIEVVYVVDAANELLRFDPRKLPGDPFKLVRTLDCEDGSPFSMAVDREGIAWVLYDSGKLYRVSILDGHCSAAGYAPEPNPTRTFGMGFASDGPKATTEQLFVAANDASQMLARIDTAAEPPAWRPIAKIGVKQSRSPELTGTGEGKLFGYFPDEPAGFIQELDRKTGAALGTRWTLATIGKVEAWAFAHWGGVFYVFATTDDKNSAVHAIHRKTGKYERVRDRLPYRITGAGVSTCAPQLER